MPNCLQVTRNGCFDPGLAQFPFAQRHDRRRARMALR
jgi:hypothetical protein